MCSGHWIELERQIVMAIPKGWAKEARFDSRTS